MATVWNKFIFYLLEDGPVSKYKSITRLSDSQARDREDSWI